jgi:hypothetical protein
LALVAALLLEGLLVFWSFRTTNPVKEDHSLYVLASAVLPGIYVIARLCMITELFLAFRKAPSSVYTEVDWTAYFGHFGA